MNVYFVYDGRASVSIDDACVLECFEASNENHAKKLYKKLWGDIDSVLTDKDDNIIS